MNWSQETGWKTRVIIMRGRGVMTIFLALYMARRGCRVNLASRHFYIFRGDYGG
ncbi:MULTISPECIES: hypothetical protein [Aminobacterium]|uniref:hypothetical protein n=1 Tax=Aminobacterium TaxID=81466 RepID=UPI0012EC1909|nr:MULTISPECIES: hypothetical protein [Aminobacterium]